MMRKPVRVAPQAAALGLLLAAAGAMAVLAAPESVMMELSE